MTMDNDAVRQSRAVLARVQSPGARGGPGRDGAAARAREVPRHLQLESGRVLHGPGGGAQAPDRRRRPHDRTRRADPERDHAAVAARSTISSRSSTGASSRAPPAPRSPGIRLIRPGAGTPEQTRYLLDYFQRGLARGDAARRRSRPPVPASREPGPLPRGLARPVAESPLPRATLSLLHVPPTQVAPRFVALPAPADQSQFMLLEDVMRLHLPRLYKGYEILSSHGDPRHTRRRGGDPAGATRGPAGQHRGGPARAAAGRPRSGCSTTADLPADILTTLLERARAGPDGPLRRARASPPSPTCSSSTPRWTAAPEGAAAAAAPGAGLRARHRHLERDPRRATSSSITRTTRFDASPASCSEAAVDPEVLAIKMTLYRVSPASPIAQRPARAPPRTARRSRCWSSCRRASTRRRISAGPARWRRSAPTSSTGWSGFKTHCKACLVVRQETDGIRRYCHLATGNYNVRTAGVYTDLGLFTCRDVVRRGPHRALQPPDRLHAAAPGSITCCWRPPSLRDGLIERIRREASQARVGPPARIIAKMNALVDRRLIEELYAASAAGVEIDLIVRGICCLRPGVPGLSRQHPGASRSSIAFSSTPGSSISRTAANPEYLLASADWMPRNLDRRVEIAFPVLDPRRCRRACARSSTSSSPTPSRPAVCSPTAPRSACTPRGGAPCARRIASTN